MTANTSPSDTSGSKKKKAKKNNVYIYGGAAALALVVAYLWKKHQANTAAASTGTTGTSSAIDPATGLPYARETGANAINPTTGNTYASDLANLTDPNTGQTYASEVASLNATSGAEAAQTTTLATEVSTLSSDLKLALKARPIPPASKSLAQWKLGAIEQLKRIGVAPAQAQKAVEEYLSGKPVTNVTAAHGLSNIISPANALGAPPMPHGHVPPVRVARASKIPTTKKK